MRNLNEHPITLDEKLKAIDWAIDMALTGRNPNIVMFGDVKIAALRAARADVEAAG